MFRFCKGKVEISIGFCLLITWFALINGWQLLITVLGAAMIHELGHWMVLRALKVEILGFRVCVFGAVLETDSCRLSYMEELAAILAGPMANLLGAFLLAQAGNELAAGAHLVLGMFNLIPIRPLDGGRALDLFITDWMGPVAGEIFSRSVGAVTATMLGGGTIWLMARSGGNLWLLPTAIGAIAVIWRECCGNQTFL